jgi:hypothetical protein
MSKYSVTSGKIFKDDALIGRYDQATGKLVLHQKLSNPAEFYIKSVIYDQMMEMLPSVPAPEGHTIAVMQEPASDPVIRGVFPEEPIPPPPECEPRLGDLTPAYVEWMAKHHEDTFEEHYKGRIPKGQRTYTPTPFKGDIPAEHQEKIVKEEWR